MRWNILKLKVPEIDSFSDAGEKIEKPVGNINFQNILFSYPARPDIDILKEVTLDIKAGTTVALVGSSGCGKSTCIQLIQRFYDPKNGLITFDGKDLKSLNLNWLRSQIGVVSQEPVLFGTSILENIRLGREDATEDEIMTAAINANAHDFIMELPQVH